MNPAITPDVGLGYTLATGNLYCEFADFHVFAERLLGRPVYTHEFASLALWDAMRAMFEQSVTEGLVSA